MLYEVITPVIVLNMPIHQASDQVSRSSEHIAWLSKTYDNVTGHDVDLTPVFEQIKTTLPGDIQDGLTMANTVITSYSIHYTKLYEIFEDGTDIYWARSRVMEYLNFVSGRLPAGVTPSLGPDATGVGWIYEYTLQDTRGNTDLQQLRSLQDWAYNFVSGMLSEVITVAGPSRDERTGRVRRGDGSEVGEVELEPDGLAAAVVVLDAPPARHRLDDRHAAPAERVLV